MYDTLIDQVELPELLAILGHEIGHWQLSHALQGFVIVQVNRDSVPVLLLQHHIHDSHVQRDVSQDSV